MKGGHECHELGWLHPELLEDKFNRQRKMAHSSTSDIIDSSTSNVLRNV